jgi:hypothetical protein
MLSSQRGRSLEMNNNNKKIIITIRLNVESGGGDMD